MSLKILLALFFMFGYCISQDPQEGLIAHYPFLGNANDMSGNGNNGIVYGPTLNTDRFNQPDGAYQFDGVDDYIVIPDSDILTPRNNQLTVAIWAKVKYPGDKYFLYKGDYHYNRE